MPSSGCPWQGFPKRRVDAALAFACTYCRPMVGWWLLLVIHYFKHIPMWALIVSHPQPPTDSPPAPGWGKQKWADGRSYEGQWQARACEGGTGQAGQVATDGCCNSWSFLLPKIFLTSIEILKLFLTQSFAYDVSFFLFLSFALKFEIPWDVAAGQRDAWPGSLSMAGWSYVPWKLPKWFEVGMNSHRWEVGGTGDVSKSSCFMTAGESVFKCEHSGGTISRNGSNLQIQ